ncbi:imidazoleglycerol-phosphate dehydratase HisB [Desulforamulus hydrothermalis]|uniref:Imidazoleglycerol-phosphate dehydratase n=1 Tax=Desulforamulus hydrothermalis Lam5 = DSM 18033 TaxID=1121428 RepID=K8EC10_9FIRM|nr:imidazoleglycerol-phosphate dehydratase HisB [Desulforamulus hydrothermalis]CCO09238.1 Imidazoleglycerol-phosphate dehydratase [Desulforamulus hydrothermalis Lam5 = DSM 18033]SHH05854.1 imidazoleglycerol-phosphate dehydratase [Desulforamulus hydrothermalis Lam5 = DSM 18033]
MTQRQGRVARRTGETDIEVFVSLDGTGDYRLQTGVGFLEHMLSLLAKHGALDLTVRATGDTHIDDHHTVEDIGITLGMAVRQALGDKQGINRYGHALVPMDEALVLAVTDISGRGHLAIDLPLPAARVGNFDTELVEEFMRAFALNSGITLHIRLLSGRNTHHIIEAAFKALGRALRQAAARDGRLTDIPSTKGVL